MDAARAADLRDLIDALGQLAGLDPIERARRAPDLIDRAKGTLSAIRREAIHEATRETSWDDVAAQLGVSVGAVNKAITAYRREAG